MAGLYDAWRVNGGPTQHAPNPTAVTADVLEVGFIFAIAVLGFCFVLVVPGYRGWMRFCFFCRVIVSLFILSAVLVGVLGQEWGSAEVHTRTPYKAFSAHEIEADIGIKIGLASVNITLKTDPVVQSFGSNVNETIDYNERFHWNWRQGRLGFGPYAGTLQQEFRAAQFRGIPLPILWIAEYFTLDGELIRWGRSFRTAGWFTWIILWTAFPSWIIANILSLSVLLYCGFMFFTTGVLMLVSTIVWTSIRWGHQPLVIPFEDGSLSPHYGPTFWLVVSGGIVSCTYGLVIVAMYLYAPEALSDFFGIDLLQDTEEYFHSEKDRDEESAESGNGSHTAGFGHYQTGAQKRITRHTIMNTLGARERRRSRNNSRRSSSRFDPVIPVYTNDGFDQEHREDALESEATENNGNVYMDKIGEDPIYQNSSEVTDSTVM